MITDNNRKATIIAYYFSKFDRDAMRELGYSTLSEAFFELSAKIGKKNDYIRLRRDEFAPLTGGRRVGFNKREPNVMVQTFHNGLKSYTFEELTEIVKTILNEEVESVVSDYDKIEARKIIQGCTEEELELIMNGRDTSSRIVRAIRESNNRVFDTRIQKSLKKLYEFRCQICGARAIEMYGVDISAAHHLELFSLTANNDAKNIMIVCPDHHRIIHKAKPMFNTEFKRFDYSNGKQENLMYNIHL